MKTYLSPCGTVRLYNCDCRKILDNLTFDVCISDPPYNIGVEYDGYGDSMDWDEYAEMLRITLRMPLVMIHYPEETVKLSWAFEEVPTKMVAWVYPSNLPRNWRTISWWLTKPDLTAIKQPYRNTNDKRIIERIANGEQARSYDWWEENLVKNVSSEKTEHPCQIPLSLMDKIIAVTSGNTILDPYMGTGTTGVAAIRRGRKFVGIEQSEKYFDIAVGRIKAELSQLKLQL